MLEVTNTGNVRLQAPVVQVQSNCTGLPALGLGASVRCSVTKLASQADFDTWDLAMGSGSQLTGRLQLAVTVSAQPVTTQALQTATATVAVPLVSRPSFKALAATLSAGNYSQAVRAGECQVHLKGETWCALLTARSRLNHQQPALLSNTTPCRHHCLCGPQQHERPAPCP